MFGLGVLNEQAQAHKFIIQATAQEKIVVFLITLIDLAKNRALGNEDKSIWVAERSGDLRVCCHINAYSELLSMDSDSSSDSSRLPNKANKRDFQKRNVARIPTIAATSN